MPLHVSPSKRHLLKETGEPFFYLADTAWQIFHSLSFEDASLYLESRNSQKFTVIQATILSEFDGLLSPNFYGHTPLLDLDPAKPNEAYFKHVDKVLKQGADLGLTWGLLPTWGDKWNNSVWGVGPEVFTPENAYAYGLWLGKRYRHLPLIWILGGDRPILTDRHREITAAMARGLREGDGGSHLITFHPCGGKSSSDYVQNEPWLDFNMLQSGHESGRMDNYSKVFTDYNLAPTRPCMDAEPPYENHPDIALTRGEAVPYFDDRIVRRAAWQALFAGACGHAYGCHDIWQFYDGIAAPHNRARTPWKESLYLPGAVQMRHLRNFFEKMPWTDLFPDNHMASVMPSGEPIFGMRNEARTIALFYFPGQGTRSIQLAALTGSSLAAYWFDPRTGQNREVPPIEAQPVPWFTPPEDGIDWILVLHT